MYPYQNIYQPQTMNNQYFQPNNITSYPMNNTINWVQGIEGANAIQLKPNSNIVLLDSTQNVLYIKSTDNIGLPTIRTFKMSEVSGDVQSEKYVTRQEFNELINKLSGGNTNVTISGNEQSNTISSTNKTI